MLSVILDFGLIESEISENCIKDQFINQDKKFLNLSFNILVSGIKNVT